MLCEQVARRLQELTGRSIAYATDCVGDDAKAKVEQAKEGEVGLCVNVHARGLHLHGALCRPPRSWRASSSRRPYFSYANVPPHAMQVVLLENLRFHPEEEGNEEDFARRLAGHAKVFVNDGR